MRKRTEVNAPSRYCIAVNCQLSPYPARHLLQQTHMAMFMMFFPILLSLASVVAAQPTPDTHDKVVTSTACSQIAHSYELWTKNGGNGDFSNIPGQTAYDCLMSMPFDSERAVQFLDEYLKYLQFQSTLDTLKHPPSGYKTPSIDLLKGFDKIRKKAETNSYKSQYEFDNDIKHLIHRANEGHLEIYLCSHQVFRFHRSPPLVSISSDGLELPRIYTWSDAKLLRSGFPNTVSHLVEINSIDAAYFLQAHVALTFEYHDPDARYNHLFPSPANQFTGIFTGGGWQSYQSLWPGAAQYLLKFHNGTTLEVNTTAIWHSTSGPMNYTDGETLFKAACLPDYVPSLMSFFSDPSLPPPRHTINGDGPPPPSTEGVYPDPVVRNQQDSLRGYYLQTHSENDDTAVLQIPTFLHTGGINFSQTALEFITRASSQQDGNKTKLIVDLTGNTGGDVIPGFNIFKILFPDQAIRTATRFRATELVNLVGKVYSEVYRHVDDPNQVPIDPPFVAKTAVGPDQKRRFGEEWEGLFGPVEVVQGGGGNMSRLLGHFDLEVASTVTDPVYGYGPFASMVATEEISRPFAAENIVVITNGQCASTCALLVSLLHRQGGVRTLAFGGRPRHAPMQTVGGVKGGQHWSLRTIYRHVSRAVELATDSMSSDAPSGGAAAQGQGKKRRPLLTGEELARLKELAPANPDPGPQGFEAAGSERQGGRRRGFPLRMGWRGEGGVNFRDLYYVGDEDSDEGNKVASEVPAQFVYEPAECRRFFTVEMMFRPAKMWEVAREVMYGEGTECVDGRKGGG